MWASADHAKIVGIILYPARLLNASQVGTKLSVRIGGLGEISAAGGVLCHVG